MSRSNFLKTKQLAIYWMLFHPQTLSNLLSQLLETHLGIHHIALLFFPSIMAMDWIFKEVWLDMYEEATARPSTDVA